ncbi:hypothetical protein Fmac_006495 [Flemingia macrophylla]|uniref:Transposase n=1 Tax=Flemingia macrophylla TaxID=520843 RepID=A0ABD1NAU2_9FABA
MTSKSTNVIEDTLQPQNPMDNMLNDAFGFMAHDANDLDGSLEDDGVQYNMTRDADNSEFDALLKDNNQQLYEGCTEYSKLSFILKLYHIKCMCRMSDKGMTMILELLKDAFKYAKFPNSFYEAKKIINKLGLNYTKIPACPKDCMLYWGEENKGLEECRRCKTSKWKDKNKKQYAKILRYFPLKPRLQRLFMCSKTAESMRWHALEDNQDGLMRHPKDSEAWKTFDRLHPEFSIDPRNVRLGLTTDGFNPFGAMSTSYSIWPVVLIPYNRAPWECMKQTSFILSMIIPGKQMPGNDIDVYLQPLIKELKELWFDGVQTFDSSKNEMFRMRAALMWTISDFPGLGTLSGWNTHTSLACPTCNFDTAFCWLNNGKKYSFMGHRRFLEKGHKFRLNRSRFNGRTEQRDQPTTLSGSDIFKQVEDINVTFGKPLDYNETGKRTRGNKVVESVRPEQWRKKSIFF